MEKTTRKKIYVTSYAADSGRIHEYEAEVTEVSQDGYVGVRGPDRWRYYKVGIDFFFNREEAVKEAESMRSRKIAHLEEEIKKLKAFKF